MCVTPAMGADAVLLIVAALDDAELGLLGSPGSCSLTALVEVHDETELPGPWLPGPRWWASTSGTCTPSKSITAGTEAGRDDARRCGGGGRVRHPGHGDVRRLAEAGYHAVLVGETLVRSGDRRAAVGELLGSAHEHPGVVRRRADADDLFVKICGITSEADALLAVGMGASAVGFIFAPSPRQMAPIRGGRHRQAPAP